MAAQPKNQNQGRIIGARKDGLGARILLLLNCIRIAELLKVPYRLYWPTDDGLAPNLHHPEELFSSDYMEKVFLPPKEHAKIKANATPMWKFNSATSPDKILKHLAQGKDILLDEGFEVFAFAWEDPDQIRHEFSKYIKQVEFITPVRGAMKQVDAVYSSKMNNSIAYHLRRGDILDVAPWKDTGWPTKIEVDELYEVHLEKNPDAISVMFSDTNAIIEKFQAKYPHLKSFSDLMALDGFTDLQRDFLELYAMSRADQIIAPSISAFSMAAARIAGRQRIRFIEALSEEDIDEAYERTMSRLASGADTYLNPSDAAHAFFKASMVICKPKFFQANANIFHDSVAIVKKLKQQQADNAFLEILQAVNHVYLQHWYLAIKCAQAASKHPNIWPNDFASAKAIQAMAHGHQNQRAKAGNLFREAYLYKPLNNTIISCGTNMSLNVRLNERNFLPLDTIILRHAATPKDVDVGYSYVNKLAISSMHKRRNFRFVTIDWHELVIDGKASRISEDVAALKEMERQLLEISPEKIERSSAPFLSMHGLIQAMQGHLDEGLNSLNDALMLVHDRALYYKRIAVVYELRGEHGQADKAYKTMIALEPKNPFFLHAWAMFQLRCNKKDAAFKTLKQAADLEQNTASISADYAMAAFRKKEYATAEKSMQNAIRIIPVYGRFQNQLKRIQSKMK